jgi:radical SAM protein (TIGR04043 family)
MSSMGAAPARADLDRRRLAVELQSLGVRVAEGGERPSGRRGGAGPSDAGFMWIGGMPLSVPFYSEYASRSPYVLRSSRRGYVLYRDDEEIGPAFPQARPRYYDLETAGGIPYWKIALLHLDSLASTVVQRCVYYDTWEQCKFCGIELTLRAGRTTGVKRPEQLAEVALAARDLDGAKDITLTTGTANRHDKGARYIARCAREIRQATGMPVQVQFEPPTDLAVLEEVKAAGVDAVGIHVETFDPEVLAWVAPAKAAIGIEGYFRTWRRAVELFGRGQVSTYVILGMGERRELIEAGCRRAADEGVFPFIVPLRPVPGTPMEDFLPPAPDYVERMYRAVVPQLAERGLSSKAVRAGCARCQACSAMSAFETGEEGDGGGHGIPLPLAPA